VAPKATAAHPRDVQSRLNFPESESEEFRPIPGFPGYRLSNLGRLQSCWEFTPDIKPRKGRLYSIGSIWKDITCSTTLENRKVAPLRRDGKRHYISLNRLVATVFIGPRPEGMICRHLNGNPSDDRASNLAWGTWDENYDDAVRHGTVRPRRSSCPQITLPPEMKLRADDSTLASLEGREVFLPVPGFPGILASNLGAAVSIKRGPKRLLRQFLNTHGYLRFGVGNCRAIETHTAVMLAFVGPRPPGAECRHINGVRTDNRLENLAWGTREENAADKRLHGTLPQGERSRNSKLTEADVREMRRLHSGGMSMKSLARKFGICESHCGQILKRKKWAHV
jgi:hypothetical protein